MCDRVRCPSIRLPSSGQSGEPKTPKIYTFSRHLFIYFLLVNSIKNNYLATEKRNAMASGREDGRKCGILSDVMKKYFPQMKRADVVAYLLVS